MGSADRARARGAGETNSRTDAPRSALRRLQVPPFHAPRFDELAELAGELARDPGTSERDGKTARDWLQYRSENAALVREIRDWPRRADDLMERYPGTDAAPEALVGWRSDAEREVADHGRLTDGKGPHAAHLAAMPEARERLRETGEWLWRHVGRSVEEELRGREAEAWRQADAAGGIAFDAPAWGVLMEQVRELGSRGRLSDSVRGEIERLKERDGRWKRDRAAVADVMDRADATTVAHEGLAPGRAGAWIEEAGETARRVCEGDGRHRKRVVAREAAERDRRQLADDVLVLACAVSERVDAASPVHRDTLPGDVRAVLASTAKARDVPEEEVERVAAGIARGRAETDMWMETAQAQRGGDVHGASAVRGRPGLQHAAGPGGVRGWRRRGHATPGPRGSPADGDRDPRGARRRRDARHGRHGLALAMAEGLERGTTATADGILKERAAVLAELQADWLESEGTIGMMVREEEVLRRVSACFTGAEVRDMCEGKGPVMDRLPGDAARTRVRDVMRKLQLEQSSDPAPWRARQETLVRELGLVRDQGAERCLGIEIDRF